MVPAFLAVSAVGAPGCNGGEKTTMSSEATEAATVGMTEPTTTPTSGETGGVPDCAAVADQAACSAVDGCTWFVELSQCILECEPIKDQATCEMGDYCEWYNGQCSMLLA